MILQEKNFLSKVIYAMKINRLVGYDAKIVFRPTDPRAIYLRKHDRTLVFNFAHIWDLQIEPIADCIIGAKHKNGLEINDYIVKKSFMVFALKLRLPIAHKMFILAAMLLVQDILSIIGCALDCCTTMVGLFVLVVLIRDIYPAAKRAIDLIDEYNP